MSPLLAFLIADVRGYTRFTVEHGDEAAARLARRFAELVEEGVERFEGKVIELRGDEALCVFPSARNALRAAVGLQSAFRDALEHDSSLPLAVGMGLDAGEAVPVKDGYRGGALNLAARLCSIAGPGEVLATRTLIALSGTVAGLRYTEREPVTLKGYAGPVDVIAVSSTEAAEQQRAGQGPASHLPRGTATFLYTDIEGSTRLWQEHPEAMPGILARHDDLLRQAIEHEQGVIFRHAGDGYCAAFVHAGAALRAAISAQRSLLAERRAEEITLAVRMAIHAGSVEVREGAYVGHTLNRVARLLSAAHGGQILLSRAAYELVRDHLPKGIELRDLGEHHLKDLLQPEHIYQVAAADLPDSFAPLVAVPEGRVLKAGDLPAGGFLGALPTGRLVARDAEMDRLLAAMAAVESGAGRCVLLAGEPGIGKTRLAQEATLKLRDHGFLIAAGSSFEPQQSVPYFPFRDVLAALYGGISVELRSQVGQLWPYLGRLLPEAGPSVPIRSDSIEEQEWLRRAVVGFVCAAAGESPVAVLLDDLHWADEASLDLLRRLALQTRGGRVLILGTYRDEEVQRQDALGQAVRDLHRAGVLERIVVRGLSQDETHALIAASLTGEVPGDVAAAVYRQTEGNPFFTQEVLNTLVERGAAYRRNSHWEWRSIEAIEVPETVRLVLDERLSRLGAGTRELLGAASVLGQTFRFDELLALGNCAEEDVEEALDEAVQRGILRETSDHYSFQHALTHAALYEDLPGRRRRRLHRAAGEALERLAEQQCEGREADLARHFLEGHDHARALSYSLLAGDRAEGVFAHSEARQHYQRALDLAREMGAAEPLREALRKLGAVLNLMGRYNAAVEALEEAVQLARQSHDLDDEIEAVACLLRHAPERRGQDDALRWVAPLLPRLEGYPISATKLEFFNAYAYYLVQTLEFDEGLRIARQTVEMAGTLGDEYELARSKVVLGHLLLWHGRGSEMETLLAPVVPYLEDAGNLPDAMRAASLLAQVTWFRGDARASLGWRERSLRLARQVGDAAQAVYETCMLGYLHLRSGDMDLAWREGLQAVDEAQELDRSTMAGSPLGLLATLSWMQGRWEDLERYAGRLISLSESSGEGWWRRHGELILALRDLLDGRPTQALARLEPLLAGTQLDMLEQSLYLPAVAEAHLETGNLQRAQEVLDALRPLRRQEMWGLLMDALRVQAMVLRAGGDFNGAERALNELLDIMRSLPYPFAEAQALSEYAHLEVTTNRLQAAREHLEGALGIFRRLAAQPFVERTERALAQLD